jgi:hypothetical protein
MYIVYFGIPPILVERPLFVVSEFDNKLRYIYHCCRADDYVEDMLRLPISVISLD